MVDKKVKMYCDEIVISDAITTEGEPRNDAIDKDASIIYYVMCCVVVLLPRKVYLYSQLPHKVNCIRNCHKKMLSRGIYLNSYKFSPVLIFTHSGCARFENFCAEDLISLTLKF